MSARAGVDVRLYALADPAAAGGRDLAELAARAVTGGATLVQLRDKQGATRAMIETARAIKAALAGSGVPVLVNDRVDVALAAGADGIHLGQDDMTPEDARRLMGRGAIVGLTVKTEAHAAASSAASLDYVCIGGVFETLSKDNPDPPVGLDGLARLAAAVRRRAPGLAVAAIAGMSAARAPAVIHAGADGIAVISALWRAGDAAVAATELRAAVDHALKERSSA